MKNEVKIIPGCEPIYIQGNDTGCLLLHGFTGSPFEMKPLAEHLKQFGYTIHLPLLPGHGTSPEELIKERWYNWFQVSKNELFSLRKKCKQVFVIGLSMGGTLALHLAAHYEIDGIIALAPGLHLKNRFARLSSVLKPIYRYISNNSGPDLKAKVKTISYPKIPVRAVSELLKLFKHVNDDLQDVYSPTLIIYSNKDHVVHPKSSKIIYDHISSRDKRILELSKSYHVITLDVEKEKVFLEINNFISRMVS